MEERRDEPPARESGPPIPAPSQLPAAQQAHLDYNVHVVGTKRVRGCQRCSDVDRDRCPEGDRLWQAWSKACDDAYQIVNRGGTI